MYVLDASAVLALMYEEPGADDVLDRINGSMMSSVNYSEVLQKADAAGRDIDQVAELLHRMLAGIVPLDGRLALETAALWRDTRHSGLSLADRSCLALTKALNGIAVTADRSWAKLQIPGVEIHVIRR